MSSATDFSPKKYAMKIRRNVFIPMSDGVDLAADIYLPDGAGRCPAILKYLPYRKDDFQRPHVEPRLRYFVERGYVGVLLDVRGTGSSSGSTERMLRLQESTDGYDAVEWIADQPWCDGNVGITGISYGGFTSYLVAAQAPPHLKASIPIYAADDFYYSAYPGGSLGLRRVLYNSMMMAFNSTPPTPDSSGRWVKVWEEHLEKNEPWLLSLIENQKNESIWMDGSVKYSQDKIKAATFIIGGWHDVFVSDPFRAYAGIRAPKKLLVGPWMHIPPWTSVPGPRINYLHEMIRWFDYWLKGKDSGITTEPPVTIFVRKYDVPAIKRDVDSGFWRNESGWPLARSVETPYYLHPDGKLNANVCVSRDEANEDIYEYDPSVGITSMGFLTGFGLDIGLPLDQRPDEVKSLTYTTESLHDSLELTGVPFVVLHVSSTANIAAFVAKLCDVSLDGSSALVSKGSLNITHRESNRHPSNIEPTRIYEIRIDLDALSYVFEKGHRIRLNISNSDFPMMLPTPKRATNKVYLNDTCRSRLMLPVVPEQENPLPTPTFLEAPAIPQVPGENIPTEWRVIDDVTKSCITVDLRFGGKMILDDRVVSTHATVQARVSKKDPADVNLKASYLMGLTGPAVATEVKAETVFQSAMDSINVFSSVEMEVDKIPYFNKKWIKTVPRQFI